MAKFRKKPIVIELEQYHNIPNGWPKGVCAGCEEIGLTLGPHVHTAHNNQAVELEDGDWIAPEPDGIHFYPIKNDIFAATFEAVENGCGICGGAMTEIRSRYPGEPQRQVCPTCLADRMDQIRQVADADYGRACGISFALPAGLKGAA